MQYSSLILTDQMTRDEALERLKKPPYDPETVHQDLEYIATKIGITGEELRGYMAAPNKTYRDYKSQGGVYRVGAKVMKMFGMTLGGKR